MLSDWGLSHQDMGSFPDDDECFHGETEAGPRISLRHGISETEICKKCGMWRPIIYAGMTWQVQPVESDFEPEPEQ